MKKIVLSIFIIFVSTILNAQSNTTISFVKQNAKDKDVFTISGTLTERVGKENYIFKDSTGSTKIEIDSDVLREAGLTKAPINTPITLKVSIDREIFEKMEIDVFEIIQNTK